MKICKKCKEGKSEEEFSKHATTKDGLAYNCKACVNQEHRNKSQYYTDRSMEWREKNFEQWKKNSTKAKLRQLLKVVFEECKGTHVNRFLKTVSTDLHTLKEYFETFFDEDLGWSNYGVLWTFDLIKPFESFDLLNKEERVAAVYYTNLKLKRI